MGTCRDGGASNTGTVFGLDPVARQEQAIHDFSNANDGANPQSELTYVNGAFYGTTSQGGTSGAGTIYRIDAATGAESVVYNFPGNAGGSSPGSGLAYAGGVLYGNTFLGGKNDHGTVFKFDPAIGAATILYRFAGGADGAQPSFETPLYVNGKLFGATYGGGSTTDPYGFGTLYSIDVATGTEQVLHRFSGADGANPSGALLYAGGRFYGVTMAGGATANGTIFAFSTQ